MVTTKRGESTWAFVAGARKLAARARLPGAYAFDRAAHALRLARGAGLPTVELLPLALGSSWLVNSNVPSPVFRRWLTPPLGAAWLELVSLLEGGATDAPRIEAALSTLAIDGQGAGALSKVLALLIPDRVPLMPDAAIAFALGSIEAPPTNTPDAQTAGVTSFLPMMAWFASVVRERDDELEEIAASHETAPLDGAQVLDRLLWFDSVGYRHFRAPSGASWCPVIDAGRGAVIFVDAPLPADVAGTGPVDLARSDLPTAWVSAARAALEAG